MNRTKLLYWIVNVVFGVVMLGSAIPDIIETESVVKFMTILGYPTYFTPFIGAAKIIGVVAIFIPGYPRMKEWAYAGLCFDLVGATYSLIAIGSPINTWWPMIIFLLLAAGAYITYRKKIALA